MYVQSVQNYNVSMTAGPPSNKNGQAKKFLNSVKQKIIDWMPSATFKDEGNCVDKWERINDKIARPMQNRLIMGGAALVTQPVIDYYNHKVDKETRKVSTYRTIAKIIVGTLVGAFVARGPAYWAVEKMTQLNGKGKLSKFLLPTSEKEIMKSLETKARQLKNYRTVWASLIALGIMLFTNFLLDAPLTMWLTNKFNNHSKKKEVKNA